MAPAAAQRVSEADVNNIRMTKRVAVVSQRLNLGAELELATIKGILSALYARRVRSGYLGTVLAWDRNRS